MYIFFYFSIHENITNWDFHYFLYVKYAHDEIYFDLILSLTMKSFNLSFFFFQNKEF